ncbi:single-stranded-DNA-specific exonuclease RecJ [Methanobacterium alcaliphilum]|uniref:single-stranded-DNA-specific exonuclease RecJ n=1 Tax=Methanobacterium alcaliphilum TaxID=392018 RepID=UPI00200ADAE8|nr:DHH family phosphoesterase [Methanobacterium alcaliphilum]MCK9151135.1 DHH family phosphoesterase [Methanobacterium alcaliphilum]
MTHKKQHSLLNRADEACQVLKEHLKRGDIVRIISHNDADGLSAAGVIANAISQEEGQFHISIVPRLRDDFIRKLAQERYKLFFFCDMGSAYLEAISRIKGDVIISDHHQPIDFETGEKITHVNPHLFGIDGSREVSASGVTYLTVRGMEKQSLAGMALAGAFGDMQYYDRFLGINQMILEEGLKANTVEVYQDLKIASKNEEPLYKSLAYTFNPVLPGLTGDLEGSMAFLEKMGVSYGIKFSDLGPEERDILKDELVKLNPQIFSDVFSDARQPQSIRNIEDYSRILDACGKNKKYGLGLGICLGEKNNALEVALDLQRKYRETLVKGLQWIKREGSTVLEHIQYIYAEEKARKSVMGTISSISLSLGLLEADIPLLAISRMDNQVKISSRTIPEMVEAGVDLGQALKDASSSFGGTGGGHDIAAGAMIPYKEMDNFLTLVDEIVGTQLE